MKKASLHHKLVAFQREIIGLSESLRREKEQRKEDEERLFLDLLTVLDAFENIFAHLADKESGFDRSAQRGIKSFRAIHRKLIRLLEDREVVRIVLEEGEPAPMAWCQVVETAVAEGREEGAVLAIVKHGYRRGERVLRPAEVMTAANRALPGNQARNQADRAAETSETGKNSL